MFSLKTNLSIALGALVSFGLLVAAHPSRVAADTAAAKALFKPLPTPQEALKAAGSKELISLGEKLYFDTRLSQSGEISCNSCHMLDSYGVDNVAGSTGHKGHITGRNSPTVYNAYLHISQFWDGRAKDVEEQALGPILAGGEMAMPSKEEAEKMLNKDAEYPNLFQAAFPGEEKPVSFTNVGKAIGAFERTLVTQDAFDEYLRGDEDALTKEQKAGLKVFMDTGCAACHSGPLLGGQMYQKVGLVKPYPTKDLGRYEVTKNEADKYLFKVPSLRNIEKTGPYFHDGKVKTLAEAVELMAWHQLGKKLSKKEVNSIVEFLSSLTGKLPAKFAKK